ncbi:hypothetical protein GH714_042371 [Hevea brasiliensis]|uniref:NAD(P)H-quinone oxidoreductase subunit N, chloroplastic n=1 Tax=Hevea brasiliensis TaxID=3981 RepID=A0A6A6LBA5_HEVBR|nr:hypothetical protein GH714_042371 [Hevea brasiliensis]
MKMAAATCLQHVGAPPSINLQQKQHHHYPTMRNTVMMGLGLGLGGGTSSLSKTGKRVGGVVRCIGIADFIGGDLVKFDLGRWLSDVEEHKALAIYTPHEGGYEGRYLTRLRYQGYYFLDLTARGLGDPETTLTKIHPVCPAHLGKQPIARWYFPPEVDYRLAALPPDAKGLVVWIIEAKVLSKAELQFLALLPSLRPKVRVIAECGNW